MILVDTSVWIDHLHRSDAVLAEALETPLVAQHPMVIGELSLGSLRNRASVLELLHGLPQTQEATHEEVMFLVEDRSLYGQGLSLVDAHLLSAVLLTQGAVLWTPDKKLRNVSEACGVAFGDD